MNVSAVKFSSQTVKRDGHGETLLSLVDPGSTTISIFDALPLWEVGRLAFTAQQCNGRPSFHGLGGSGGGPFCTYLSKGVMTLYWSTNIENSIPFRRWGLSCSHLDNAPGVRLRLKILLFILFIFYMFYYSFF